MCKICNQWNAKEISAQEAMDMIGQAFKTASDKQVDHLVELSSQILDEEVPMTQKNEALEEKWWDEYGPKQEE